MSTTDTRQVGGRSPAAALQPSSPGPAAPSQRPQSQVARVPNATPLVPVGPPDTHRASDPTARRQGVAGIVAGAALGALSVVALVLIGVDSPGLAALLVLPLLAGAAEVVGEEVYGSTTVSLSAIAVLAAAAAGEPLVALVAAAVAGLVTTAHARSRRPEQYVFNTAALVVAAGAALLPFAVVPATAPLPLLLVAGVVAGLLYCGVDNGLVALVAAADQGRSPAEVFRTDLSWSVPSFAAYGVLGATLGFALTVAGGWGVVAFLVPPLLVRAAQRDYLSRTRASVQELQDLNASLTAANAEVRASAAALADRHRATASALAQAIDARDHTTGGHVERVAALGQELLAQVDPELASDPSTVIGFLLHDVGKIGVPDAVLSKPGPLDPAERALMDRHPEIGHRIVREAGFPPVVAEVVLTHHERWDGSGYPYGLVGEEVPFHARLFSVADALDAMTSDRPYRRGMPLDDALAELQRCSGTQFDPAAVDAVLQLDRALLRSLLRLDSRGDAQVLRLP